MPHNTSENPLRQIVASYTKPVIRAYSLVRFAILRQVFLDEIGQYLPSHGRILDIGCGFGLFSLYFASVEPSRRIEGVDSDEKRIGYARASAAKLGLDNATYHVGDAVKWRDKGTFDAIYMLDLLHHLPRTSVPSFLEEVRQLLAPDGILLIKDIEDHPAWKRWFTLLLDRLMVGMEPVHYWSIEELSSLLEQLGFSVKHHRMKDFLPYPHILYICERHRQEGDPLS